MARETALTSRRQQAASVTQCSELTVHPSVQQTLASPARISGRGLFHGVNCDVKLLPADDNTGIVFRRSDRVGKPTIPARVENVSQATRRTVLAANGTSVETTEHLLAALSGLRVDNCIVELNAQEVPAVDGSCLPFCEAILEQGLVQQSSLRRVFHVHEAHAAAGEGGERMEVTSLSGDDFSICYQLDYGTDSVVPSGSFSLNVTPDVFLSEIAAARTFVLEAEIEALQRMGYGRHLTAGDILVFAEDGTIPDNALRWSDEPVRHKILDCIGDLALCGFAFSGQIIARRSGHKLNHVMASIVSMMSTRGITTSRAA